MIKTRSKDGYLRQRAVFRPFFKKVALFFARHFLLKRFGELLFVLLGVTFLTFIVTSAAPSDPAEMYYLSRGITPSEALLEKTRAEMGLDAPVLIRYFRWLTEALRGNLGDSVQFGESVFTQLARKLPATLSLAGGALVLMILIAFPLGVVSAVHKGKISDFVIRLTSLLGISLPNFWLALLLLYFLAVKTGWFPVIGSGDLRSMVLPVLTLSIPLSCSYIRQIRTAVLEEMGKEYMEGLRVRGIPKSRIIVFHLLPGILPTLITLLSLSVGQLLGGAAIIETIFGWPGIGSMVVEAIRVRDYPLIQGYVIWMAVIYLLAGLMSDAVIRLFDPRISRSGTGLVRKRGRKERETA